MAKDIVCGMLVDEAKTPFTAARRGTTYYFCSPYCAFRFELIGPASNLRTEIVMRRAATIQDLESERGSKLGMNERAVRATVVVAQAETAGLNTHDRDPWMTITYRHP